MLLGLDLDLACISVEIPLKLSVKYNVCASWWHVNNNNNNNNNNLHCAKSLTPDVTHVLSLPGSLIFLHASLKNWEELGYEATYYYGIRRDTF